MLTKTRTATVTIASFALLTTLGILSQAHAAEPTTASAPADLETIVVTGSRIARSTFETPAPVTVLTDQEINAVGATNLGEFLAKIPSVSSEINNSNNVFGNTTSGLQLVALRNLGSQRTLVLVNGRRFVSGVSPGEGYGVDLNDIPVTMIDRIEILTGGTSAVYGSDAIAGVVNIITKNDFEGFEIHGQASTPEDGDRNRQDFDVTIGGNFDKGNAWASFAYSKDEGMSARDRSFSNTDLAHLNGEGELFLGSSFIPAGRFTKSGIAFKGDGTPFVSGVGDQANSDRFNRASVRDLASPVERRFGTAGATYNFTDQLSSSLELNYAQYEVNSTFEPFPLDLYSNIWKVQYGGTGGMDINSPLIPALLRTNLSALGVTNLNQLGFNNTARRLVEGGNRGSDIDRRTFRVAGDINYVFENNLTWNTSTTWGQTKANQSDNVGINSERTAQALNVEVDPTDPTGATLRCINADARRAGCVPFNLFGVGKITAGAIDYVKSPATVDQLIQQLVVTSAVSGDVPFDFELPGGKISFALGVEYREERGEQEFDAATQTGINTSNQIENTKGDFDVKEAFAELRIPVLEKLIFDAAYRIGDYSTIGTEPTWKLGFDSPLNSQIRLRGTYSSSVRAPNISDLYSAAAQNFAPVNDTCNGVDNTTPGDIGANCRSVPAIAARIAGPDGAFVLTQVEIQSTGGFDSGNPNLKHETADSYTLGVVLTPEFAEGLSIALDWYDIDIDDAITQVERTDTVQRCTQVDPAVFDPTCGGALLRDPASGFLIEVNRSVQNIENITTNGLDVEIAYAMDLNNAWDRLVGSLSVGLLYNYLNEYERTDQVSGDVNVEDGEIDYPENRATLTFGYTLNNLDVNYRINFLDQSVDANDPNDTTDLNGDPVEKSANTCAARFYQDVQANYQFTEALSAAVGINNLLDTDPCYLTQLSQYGATGINTNPIYDVTGREYYLGIRFAM